MRRSPAAAAPVVGGIPGGRVVRLTNKRLVSIATAARVVLEAEPQDTATYLQLVRALRSLEEAREAFLVLDERLRRDHTVRAGDPPAPVLVPVYIRDVAGRLVLDAAGQPQVDPERRPLPKLDDGYPAALDALLAMEVEVVLPPPLTAAQVGGAFARKPPGAAVVALGPLVAL